MSTYRLTIEDEAPDPEAIAGHLEDIAIKIRSGQRKGWNPSWVLEERHEDKPEQQ